MVTTNYSFYLNTNCTNNTNSNSLDSCSQLIIRGYYILNRCKKNTSHSLNATLLHASLPSENTRTWRVGRTEMGT